MTWVLGLHRGQGRARAGASLAFIAMIGLAGCASSPEERADRGPGPAPSRPENLCAVFAERPGWREAAVAASIRWQAPVELVMAILWQESRFRPAARPRTASASGAPISSAFGYAQAIDGTWAWYRRDSGNRGARRDVFEDAVDFVGWYLARTRETNDLPLRDAYGHYIAYHEGHAGYARGAWRRKTRLLQVAERVAVQASRYRTQIGRGC